METLRKKYVNPNLVNKTCKICKKTYPRTKEFFYPIKDKKHSETGIEDKLALWIFGIFIAFCYLTVFF